MDGVRKRHRLRRLISGTSVLRSKVVGDSRHNGDGNKAQARNDLTGQPIRPFGKNVGHSLIHPNQPQIGGQICALQSVFLFPAMLFRQHTAAQHFTTITAFPIIRLLFLALFLPHRIIPTFFFQFLDSIQQPPSMSPSVSLIHLQLENIGGEGRNRTDEYSFCRAVPYHLATPPT